MTRDEAITQAVSAIGDALRARFRLHPNELEVLPRLVFGGDVELELKTRGAGAIVMADAAAIDLLVTLRAEHAGVLDGSRWEATVGERQHLAEMPEGDFAARMRGKVKR